MDLLVQLVLVVVIFVVVVVEVVEVEVVDDSVDAVVLRAVDPMMELREIFPFFHGCWVIVLRSRWSITAELGRRGVGYFRTTSP